jgi:hypothetical protein
MDCPETRRCDHEKGRVCDAIRMIKEGLKDIECGICIIEEELSKPICLPPICR